MKLNIKIMKILINGKDTAELSTCCRWSVRDGKLFNENTNRFEGVNGDVITFTKENGEKYEGTVSATPAISLFVQKKVAIWCYQPKKPCLQK